METLVTIHDILEGKHEYRGSLFLPKRPWSLNTQGVFVEFDKNAKPGTEEDQLPEFVRKGNWQEILDAASIEDIVINAKLQLESPSIENLFQAFIYYVDNDAFIDF